ncbi:Clc-like protein [Cooperia oncophora]
MVGLYATVTEPLHCVYKFDYDKYSGTFDLEDDNSPVGEVNRHKFYGWHTATLILLGFALITSFLAICLGMCSCCYGSLSLVFTAACLLTSNVSFVSCCWHLLLLLTSCRQPLYQRHRGHVRAVRHSTFSKGSALHFSWKWELHLLTSLLSSFPWSLPTFLSLVAKEAPDRYSLQRSSRTNVTNIGRSMEFDAPLMYQSQTPQSIIRPPYSKQDEYERTVAESMPELVNRLDPRLRNLYIF